MIIFVQRGFHRYSRRKKVKKNEQSNKKCIILWKINTDNRHEQKCILHASLVTHNPLRAFNQSPHTSQSSCSLCRRTLILARVTLSRINTFFAFPNCTNSVKDFQNAEKLLWRFNLQFGSLFLFIFRLSVSHGADNSAVMAAAAVVSMGK